MIYMTAKSYANWERVGEPFEKKGKLYQKVKTKCGRCGGLGIIVARIENGKPIPIPVDSGICYACGGSKYQTKDVRLYTEQEFARMEKSNEKAKAKRQAMAEAKMKAEFETKRKEWLAKNNFDLNGYTYIITGDSYSIKDELKQSGWRYDPILKWHKANPIGYEDRAIQININDFFEQSAWGTYTPYTGAKSKVESIIEASRPASTSKWIGEIDEKLKNIPVTLVGIYPFEGRYGMSQVVKFQDECGNQITWFTAVEIKIEVGESCFLSGTIRKHAEYKGEKTTIVTRCHLS